MFREQSGHARESANACDDYCGFWKMSADNPPGVPLTVVLSLFLQNDCDCEQAFYCCHFLLLGLSIRQPAVDFLVSTGEYI